MSTTYTNPTRYDVRRDLIPPPNAYGIVNLPILRTTWWWTTYKAETCSCVLHSDTIWQIVVFLTASICEYTHDIYIVLLTSHNGDDKPHEHRSSAFLRNAMLRGLKLRRLLSEKIPKVLLCLHSHGIRKLQTTTKVGQRLAVAAVQKTIPLYLIGQDHITHETAKECLINFTVSLCISIHYI
jgi:hypothetical protein